MLKKGLNQLKKGKEKLIEVKLSFKESWGMISIKKRKKLQKKDKDSKKYKKKDNYPLKRKMSKKI